MEKEYNFKRGEKGQFLHSLKWVVFLPKYYEG